MTKHQHRSEKRDQLVIVVTGTSAGLGRAIVHELATEGEPVPARLGAHGPFDWETRESSVQVELNLHRGWIALACGAIGAAICTKYLAS
jgi:hypothetical protein